jgi:hypothetical protein
MAPSSYIAQIFLMNRFCFVIWNVNSFSIFSLESFYFSYTSYKNAKNYFHTTFFRQKKIIALFHEIFIRAINVKENERVLLIIFRVVYSERIFFVHTVLCMKFWLWWYLFWKLWRVVQFLILSVCSTTLVCCHGASQIVQFHTDLFNAPRFSFSRLTP